MPSVRTTRSTRTQVSVIPEEEHEQEHVQRGFTIRIPPRAHHICTLCTADYTVPLSGNPAASSARCPSCLRCEKCSGCKKIKKRKRFRKEHVTDSIFKTCDVCRERATVQTFQKRLQAVSQGACMLWDASYLFVLTFCPRRSKASVGALGENIKFLWKNVRPKMGMSVPAAMSVFIFFFPRPQGVRCVDMFSGTALGINFSPGLVLIVTYCRDRVDRASLGFGFVAVAGRRMFDGGSGTRGHSHICRRPGR